MPQIFPKAFFFDFDGVICDSEKAHMFATLKVAQSYGISFTEEYSFEMLFGFDDKGLFRHLFEIHGKQLSAQTLKELIIEKNTEFMDKVESHILFFEGVVDLISRIHQKNIHMAIVWGALAREVQACLKKGGLESYFEFMVCADHVSTSKPDPESYETAFINMMAWENTLDKKDCWVLEDSPSGLSSAVYAGLIVIAITNSNTRDSLASASYIVDHYREIIL